METIRIGCRLRQWHWQRRRRMLPFSLGRQPGMGPARVRIGFIVRNRHNGQIRAERGRAAQRELLPSGALAPRPVAMRAARTPPEPRPMAKDCYQIWALFVFLLGIPLLSISHFE